MNQDIDNIEAKVQEMSGIIEDKNYEIKDLQEEIEDLKDEKNNLLDRIDKVERVQKQDVDNIGKRLEITITEIKSLSDENNQLKYAMEAERTKKEEAITQKDNFKAKYDSKKAEAKALRNRCEKLNHELIKLQSQNNQAINFLSEQRFVSRKKENKLKVKNYINIKGNR